MTKDSPSVTPRAGQQWNHVEIGRLWEAIAANKCHIRRQMPGFWEGDTTSTFCIHRESMLATGAQRTMREAHRAPHERASPFQDFVMGLPFETLDSVMQFMSPECRAECRRRLEAKKAERKRTAEAMVEDQKRPAVSTVQERKRPAEATAEDRKRPAVSTLQDRKRPADATVEDQKRPVVAAMEDRKQLMNDDGQDPENPMLGRTHCQHLARGWPIRARAQLMNQVKPPQEMKMKPSRTLKPHPGMKPSVHASRPSYGATNAVASLDVSGGASRLQEPIRRVGRINIVRPSTRALERQEQEEQEHRKSQAKIVMTLSSDTDSDDTDLDNSDL